MAGRIRRYLRRFVIAVLVLGIGVLLLNFGLVWHYHREAAAIEREMAAKGYPATFAEVLDRQAVPAGVINGADDLLAAFNLFDDEGADYALLPELGEGVEFAPGEAIPEASLQEMKKILDRNRETLDRISSGVRAEYVRFPLRMNPDTMELLPEEFHKQLRMCARLVHVQALYAGNAGDATAALRSVDTLLRLGAHMTHQPVFVTYSNGSSVIGMAQEAAEDLMERGYIANADQFERLAALFDAAAIGDLANVVWAEAITMQEWFKAELSNAMHDAKERDRYNSPEGLFGRAIVFVYFNSFLFAQDGFLQRKIGQAVSESLGDPLTPSTTRSIDTLTMPGGVIQYLLLSPMHLDVARKQPRMAAQTRARMRTAASAARVMRFRAEQGRLPDAAEFSTLTSETHDPFGGAALQYRSNDAGFVVYSIGANARDDRGAANRKTKEDDVAVGIELPRAAVAQ